MLGVVVHTAFLYSLGLLVTLQCSRHDLSSCFGVFFLEPFSRKKQTKIQLYPHWREHDLGASWASLCSLRVLVQSHGPRQVLHCVISHRVHVTECVWVCMLWWGGSVKSSMLILYEFRSVSQIKNQFLYFLVQSYLRKVNDQKPPSLITEFFFSSFQCNSTKVAM